MRSKLRGVIPSVGRIEVQHHPVVSWVGTGWLIAEDVVLTTLPRRLRSSIAARTAPLQEWSRISQTKEVATRTPGLLTEAIDRVNQRTTSPF